MIDFSVYRNLHSDTQGFKNMYPRTDPGDYEDFDLTDDEGGPKGEDIMLLPSRIVGMTCAGRLGVSNYAPYVGTEAH